MKNQTINCETGDTTENPLSDDDILALEAEWQENAWQRIRQERNRLLVESDWTVLSDSPTSTAAWKTYRQALRDLPANTTDPFNVVWPTPPA